MSSPLDEQLKRMSAEHWALTLREVVRCYAEMNAALFGSELRLPHLTWSEAVGTWGAWCPGDRKLSLSPRLLSLGWGELVEVLKHEMAHQYVDEVLGLGGQEGPHGSSFRRVCRERGIDPRAAGEPRAPGQADPSEESSDPEAHQRRTALRRFEHLLALAQSDNQFEAESAMVKAQKILLKYNLEQAASAGKSEYSFRHVGSPTGRRMAWESLLGVLIGEHFFVEVIIVPVYRPLEKKRGSVFEMCGVRHNLETAAYTYDFLHRTALAMWKRHKKALAIPSDRDKQSFLYGVMTGFSSKLEREAKTSQEEGLVWLGDPELHRYFRRRHPHVRKVSGQAKTLNDAFAQGREVGARIVIHKGVDAGRDRHPPRLLGTGKSG